MERLCCNYVQGDWLLDPLIESRLSPPVPDSDKGWLTTRQCRVAALVLWPQKQHLFYMIKYLPEYQLSALKQRMRNAESEAFPAGIESADQWLDLLINELASDTYEMYTDTHHLDRSRVKDVAPLASTAAELRGPSGTIDLLQRFVGLVPDTGYFGDEWRDVLYSVGKFTGWVPLKEVIRCSLEHIDFYDAYRKHSELYTRIQTLVTLAPRERSADQALFDVCRELMVEAMAKFDDFEGRVVTTWGSDALGASPTDEKELYTHLCWFGLTGEAEKFVLCMRDCPMRMDGKEDSVSDIALFMICWLWKYRHDWEGTEGWPGIGDIVMASLPQFERLGGYAYPYLFYLKAGTFRHDQILSALMWALKEGGHGAEEVETVFNHLNQYLAGYTDRFDDEGDDPYERGRAPGREKWSDGEGWVYIYDPWMKPEGLLAVLKDIAEDWPTAAATTGFRRLVEKQIEALSQPPQGPEGSQREVSRSEVGRTRISEVTAVSQNRLVCGRLKENLCLRSSKVC